MTRDSVSERIIRIIYELKKGSKTPAELQEATGIPRVSIWRYCKRLTDQQIVGMGNDGKYFLRIDSFFARKGTEFADIFYHKFTEKRLFESDRSLCYDYLFHKEITFYKLKSYISEFENNRTNNNYCLSPENINSLIYQFQILDLVIALGAYLTFVLIQAVSPSFWEQKANGVPLNLKPFHGETGMKRDAAAEELVKNSLNLEMLSKLLIAKIYYILRVRKNTIIQL